jgi:hypothetical protein
MPDINGIPYVESTDLVSAYPAASQALAQEISDQLATKVDYALPVNAQTGTTYTFVLADAEKLTTASNAAAVTLTIPPQSSVTWAANTVLRVVNYGAGAVTIDGGSGVTVTNTATTIAQYGAAVAIRTGSDAWTVVPFGGGDIPAAEVSSPAATGQYSSGGFTYDYYTFTASGTLTVDTAGFADVLVIAGGGGSGYNRGAGGGAGGYLAITDAYLPAGSLTVTVGAGGAGTSGSGFGKTGNHSRLGNIFVEGGGYGAPNSQPGENGANGGGGGSTGGAPAAGGTGVSGLGNNGGDSGTTTLGSGGGGGAGGAGAVGSSTSGGNGGAGLSSSITGSSVGRAGGGAGSGSTGVATGTDGGGTSGSINGTANTGGGAAGGGQSLAGGAGGSGVVIVRVKV